MAGTTVRGSLSPSRAGDFLSCPLLYRYRTIDRLPEGSTPDAVRGTLVHAVLEDVFDLPAAERTPARTHELVEPAWLRLLERSPVAGATVPEADRAEWLVSAHEVLERWFDLEDPTRLEPAEREAFVETLLDPPGLMLRGIIDRLDVAPDGSMRVVDYKSGGAPAAGHETRALFQLRIYALILWRSRGVVPKRLQLVYLGSSETVAYDPDEADLLATERKVLALWDAISEARRTGEFEPHPSKVCDWCSFHDHCPTFGGTILPMPAPPSRRTLLRRRLRRRWRRVRRRLWKRRAGAARSGVKSSSTRGGPT